MSLLLGRSNLWLLGSLLVAGPESHLEGGGE
jgi:hypothetical protein